MLFVRNALLIDVQVFPCFAVLLMVTTMHNPHFRRASEYARLVIPLFLVLGCGSALLILPFNIRLPLYFLLLVVGLGTIGLLRWTRHVAVNQVQLQSVTWWLSWVGWAFVAFAIGSTVGSWSLLFPDIPFVGMFLISTFGAIALILTCKYRERFTHLRISYLSLIVIIVGPLVFVTIATLLTIHVFP